MGSGWAPHGSGAGARQSEAWSLTVGPQKRTDSPSTGTGSPQTCSPRTCLSVPFGVWSLPSQKGRGGPTRPSRYGTHTPTTLLGATSGSSEMKALGISEKGVGFLKEEEQTREVYLNQYSEEFVQRQAYALNNTSPRARPGGALSRPTRTFSNLSTPSVSETCCAVWRDSGFKMQGNLSSELVTQHTSRTRGLATKQCSTRPGGSAGLAGTPPAFQHFQHAYCNPGNVPVSPISEKAK